MRILADVRVHESGFAAGDLGIGLFQLDLTAFGGLNFRTGKHHSGFKTIKKMVVVACGSVVAQNFDVAQWVRQVFPPAVCGSDPIVSLEGCTAPRGAASCLGEALCAR